MSIKDLVSEVQRLRALSEDRALEMSLVRSTNKEYLELENHIKIASKRMKEIEGNNEYAQEYNEALEKLRAAMEEEGIYATEGAKLKFREKKKVNPLAVKATLDDEDQFMSLVEIPQTKLKAFAKDNETLKKPLLSCVEVLKTEITGIEVE